MRQQEHDTNDDIPNRMPVFGVISLLVATLGNMITYGMMTRSGSDGWSNYANGIAGAILCFFILCIAPVLAFISLGIFEKPKFYAILTLIIEGGILSWYFIGRL